MRIFFLPLFLLASCDSSKPTAQEEEPIVWEKSDMKQWTAIQFGGEGAAQWNNEVLHLDLGVEMTGSRYDGPAPTVPYEIRLEARKLNGNDFFCGLTFPVNPETSVSLIVGGWGGGTVGISSIDDLDASEENGTTSYRNFETDQWYAIRVRVGKNHLSAWIDDEQVVDVDTEGRKLGLRSGPIELCTPLGLAAWQTEAEFRGLEWRSLAD